MKIFSNFKKGILIPAAIILIASGRRRQYRGIFPACPDRKECPERWRKHHRDCGGLCAAKRNAAG